MSLASVAFRALPLWGKAALIITAATTVVATYKIWEYRVYRRGYDAAIAAIAAQDERAINAAKQGRDRYRTCVESGGVWDVTRGSCAAR
jgi:hypothetical protein